MDHSKFSTPDLQGAFDALTIQCFTTEPVPIPAEVSRDTAITDSQMEQSRSSPTTDIRRVYDDTLGIECPITGSRPTPAGLIPDQITASRQQSNNSLVPDVASGCEAANQSLSSPLLSSSQAEQSVARTKEWHQSVTQDVRKDVVYKLTQRIYLTPDPQVLPKKRMRDIVAYAEKVEGAMYEIANSRAEYYHLVAEKIFEIQDTVEKRQELKEQQQQGTVSLQQSDTIYISRTASIFEAANKLLGRSQAELSIDRTKEWYQSVALDLRKHLVSKLAQAIYQTPDPQVLPNTRILHTMAYARKLEGDIYEIANSVPEYCRLLAKKMYEIRKKVEKKQKRIEQLQEITASLQTRDNSLMSDVATESEAANYQSIYSQLLDDSQAEQPIAGTKEWHLSVTPNLRNHFVHILVHTKFPSPDLQVLLPNDRMNKLVEYARRVEGEIYEMANSRSEYYDLLVEKIRKIQEELEEKIRKWKEQQLQQQPKMPDSDDLANSHQD